MKSLTLFTFLCLYAIAVLGQSPGFIVRPSSGSGPSTLNPNADRYTSATSLGFTTNDITQSEIPYKIIKPLFTSEPTGDLATGPSGGYSDIVKNRRWQRLLHFLRWHQYIVSYSHRRHCEWCQSLQCVV